jgi:hypothetical protein
VTTSGYCVAWRVSFINIGISSYIEQVVVYTVVRVTMHRIDLHVHVPRPNYTELTASRACEMAEDCGYDTVELRCVACDSTAILVD